MKKQAFNPYLPSYEYVPDAEPHVFDGRLYIYGSHDRFDSNHFCMNDYVTWSAPLDDLGNWRYEGVIFQKTQDPDNANGKLAMWAPDLAQGPDGRYYLFYCLANYNKIGVAVCDSPCGKFKFLDYVHYDNGDVLGQREEDLYTFDPGVFVDDDSKIYLFSGNAPMRPQNKKPKGSLYMQLKQDMVTIIGQPKTLIPTVKNSGGTGFEGHEFFEASSLRKFKGRYYFIYSSVLSHELCYAVSDKPDEGYRYGGTLVSNGDIGLQGEKSMNYNGKANKDVFNYIGNTHGSLIEMNGKYYVFYHRQTNRHMFSRQGCAEEIQMREDGGFKQAEMTSCGLNGGPLNGKGIYEAQIACNLMSKGGAVYSVHPLVQNKKHPAFTQDGKDREDNPNQHIENMKDGATAGFKYLNFNGTNKIAVTVRGKGQGKFIISDDLKGNMVAEINLKPSKEWSSYEAPLKIANGVHPLFFTYSGKGAFDFMSFELK